MQESYSGNSAGQPFNPLDGFEEGPLTTSMYFGVWGLTFFAAILAAVGSFVIHPGVGMVMLAFLARKSGELLIPYYQMRSTQEQQRYAARKYEQIEKQRQAAATEAAQKMMAEAEREIRRG